MCSFKYSENGLVLTKKFEGLRLTAYADQVGVWTVGYGHTGKGVRPGLTITEDLADTFLESDVAGAAAGVNKMVTAEINQHQFDALVDFAFNLGCASLASSTLLRYVNKQDFANAANQFQLWDHAGGRVIQGLLDRRLQEATLFSTPA